ncbi:zincin [Trametopsis cervina]|nr:zincin [Trametopsis cervina]
MAPKVQDPTSCANYHELASEHIDINWSLDFEKNIITGSVTHTLLVKGEYVKQAIFDTSGLVIRRVEVDGRSAQFQMGPEHPNLGAPLYVRIRDIPEEGERIRIKVIYSTTDQGDALEWLTKEQTHGKQHPFMFSQCVPTQVRSLAPVQVSPMIKTTYTARVSSVLPVMMSAVCTSPLPTGPVHDGKIVGKDMVTYTFEKTVPIPAFAIAIASGNIVYRPFDAVEGKTWTSGIWAEPELITAAHWEFSEIVPRAIVLGESILPPYPFGFHDILVLPPSFPYSMMSNAGLTFCTPNLLSGDRSLVPQPILRSVVGSWFAELITQANVCHIWVSEGMVYYFERVLLEKMFSPAMRGFAYVTGKNEMLERVQRFKIMPKFQRLVYEFEHGEDVDQAYDGVAPEKGAVFLLYLERILGGLDVFLPYVHDYVTTFAGKGVTSGEWRDHLFSYFNKHDRSKLQVLWTVELDDWWYEEGLTYPVPQAYDNTLTEAAKSLAKSWGEWRDLSNPAAIFSLDDIAAFDVSQKAIFIQHVNHLFPPLTSTRIEALANIYKFANSPNGLVRLEFYKMVLKDPTSTIAKKYAPLALDWVVGKGENGIHVGSLRLNMPIFNLVNRVDHDLAVATYREHQAWFHPLAQRNIEKILRIQEVQDANMTTPSSEAVG